MKKLLLTIIIGISLTACSPEIGSEKWCSILEDKPKGDWTMNETKDYAKHCIFKQGNIYETTINTFYIIVNSAFWLRNSWPKCKGRTGKS